MTVQSFKDWDLSQLPGCLQHPVHVKNSPLKTKQHAVILCSSEYIRTKRWSGFRGFQTRKILTLPGLETVRDAWQPSVTRETLILASLLVLGKKSVTKRLHGNPLIGDNLSQLHRQNLQTRSNWDKILANHSPSGCETFDISQNWRNWTCTSTLQIYCKKAASDDFRGTFFGLISSFPATQE